MDYQYVIVPTGFTKDTWVQDVEAAPTDRSVVHHIVAYVRTPGSNYFKGKPKEEFFVAPPAKDGVKAEPDDVPSDWLVGYAPGQPPDMFKPGEAKLIRPGQTSCSKYTTCLRGKPPWIRQRGLGFGQRAAKRSRHDAVNRQRKIQRSPRAIRITGWMPPSPSAAK